jgi:hypothetical protein
MLDMDNPVVKRNEIERQRQIRVMIEKRWKRDLKYKKSSANYLTMKDFLKMLNQ